jgi:hypothetical protein
MIPMLLLPVLAGLGGLRGYNACSFTCGDEAWSACRSERCSSPALPEDLCADGSEPQVEVAELAGPLACADRSLEPGSFAERCGICTALARAAVAASGRQPAPAGSSALCTRAVEETAAAQLPTLRTCRMYPEGCSALLERLSATVCARAASQIGEGLGGTAVMWEAQRACGEQLRVRRNSSVADARVCEAPRDMGRRVMAISACVAAAVFAVQLAPAWLTTF